MRISGFMFLVACIAVTVYLILRWYRLAAEAHVKAKQDMQAAKANCHVRVRSLDMEIKLLGKRLEEAKQDIFEETYYGIYEKFEDFVAREHLVTRHYDDYLGQNRDSLNAELKTHAYADMATEFLKIMGDFDAASVAYQAVVLQLNDALLPENTARVAYARSTTQVAEAAEAIDQAKVSGYRVSAAENYIQEARRARQKCDTNLAAKHYSAFTTNNSVCSTHAKLALEAVHQAVQLHARLVELSKREKIVVALIEAGDSVFQRMAIAFAESAWAPVALNVQQARVHLEGTKIPAARLQTLVDQEILEHQEIETLFCVIDQAHDQIKALIHHLNKTHKRIKGCQAEMGSSLETATARIQELHDFAQGCLKGADLASAQDEERNARASLVAAKIEAQQEKPDFIAALNHSESAYRIAHLAIQQIQEKRQASADAPLVVVK